MTTTFDSDTITRISMLLCLSSGSFPLSVCFGMRRARLAAGGAALRRPFPRPDCRRRRCCISRSFVLASLRALHLDLRLRRRGMAATGECRGRILERRSAAGRRAGVGDRAGEHGDHLAEGADEGGEGVGGGGSVWAVL